MKNLAILTSGGDAPGMNSAVYAVVRYALQSGLNVYGVESGYKGLIEGKVFPLNSLSVDDVVYRGGSMFKTARCEQMKTPEGLQMAYETLKNNKIDYLVVIGGDGSFAGARALCQTYGVKVVGVPCTIDNDLAYTDFTIGFDSAVNTVMNSIKMLRDTMHCNDRTCVVEVMGRNCGDIALYAGATSGAEVILVPEVPFDFDDVVARLKHNVARGKKDNVVVVAEGAGHADELNSRLAKFLPEIELRPVTIGHVQRGGDATFRDRLLGLRMGTHAVDCLLQGKTGRVVGIVHNNIVDEDITEALSRRKTFNRELYDTAMKLVEF